MCFLPKPLGAVSIASAWIVSIFVATHHTNLIAVKTNITSVRLDDNLPALEATSPYIGKPTAVNRPLLNVLQLHWVQPTARPREGWPKVRSKLKKASAQPDRVLGAGTKGALRYLCWGSLIDVSEVGLIVHRIRVNISWSGKEGGAKEILQLLRHGYSSGGMLKGGRADPIDPSHTAPCIIV